MDTQLMLQVQYLLMRMNYNMKDKGMKEILDFGLNEGDWSFIMFNGIIECSLTIMRDCFCC